jgi:chromosomal replication initiation ATPase DnaA
MRKTVEREGVSKNLWLMVGAIDRPRTFGREAAIRKCHRAAERWGYQWSKVVSKDRHRDIVEARQIMMKHLRDSKWTYSEIGTFLGGRDHATALYGSRQAEHLIDYDRAFRARYYEFQNA